MANSPHEFWLTRLHVPNYQVWEAGKYAGISPNTVGRWHRDTTLSERERRKKLSYLELIEVAVVAAARKEGMKLAEIRSARDYLIRQFDTLHPFATLELKTDGIDMLKDYAGELIVTNKDGQMAWKSVIGERLREFHYEQGLVMRWYVGGTNSSVIIDPRLRFGSPVVEGVPTFLLRDRWKEGEDVEEMSEDLSVSMQGIQDALQFEGIDVKALMPAH